jgi:hypothetical protein
MFKEICWQGFRRAKFAISSRILPLVLAAFSRRYRPGWGCLNASAVPPDVGVFRGVTGLPRMPDVEFNLIAARLGDDTLAAKAIAVLVEQFR